ncbi:hypothetical protein [Synechococcus sp. PCC 7336]|uniref:dCTP deaminase domain-containing protein n=1 Tax=Synechococcus sp. PCC 7336 TaxID=195250 RepID=UPI0008FBCDDD|nr:hypothetical protein [Synechococcus sp. PCC 7336]
MTSDDLPRFAEHYAEAYGRYENYKSTDPFSKIAPALLNSADIADYVAKTGMIVPFDDSSKKLKPASYEVNLKGECVYWDSNTNEKMTLDINEGDEFTIFPNSIAFVTLEPIFLIPHYIALRFNLKITNVYRGLLLGTGPLVDPGFAGRLSIPLHNLTTNEYKLIGGQGLIWMEFTKLSKWKNWGSAHSEVDRKGTYIQFPLSKNEDFKNVNDYLRKADSRSIKSSIPSIIKESQESAKASEEAAKQISNRFQIALFVSFFLLLIGLINLTMSINTMSQSNSMYVYKAQQELNNNHRETLERNALLEKKIQILEERLQKLEIH